MKQILSNTFRCSWDDAVFGLFALCILVTARQGMIDDPGLGWHLRNVDAMIQNGGWLTSDPFSGPQGGSKWYTNQWLGDVALRFGEKIGGNEGIAVVTTLVLALTFRLIYRSLCAQGIPWTAAFFWTYLAAGNFFLMGSTAKRFHHPVRLHR